jgi:hypothetical protein
MLPVKSILKEYLADDADETAPAEEAAAAEAEEETADAVEPVVKEEEKPVEAEPALPAVVVDISGSVMKEEEVKEVVKEEVKEEKPVETAAPPPPTIHVDTEPSVSFTEMDTVFHYDPSKNVIGPNEQVPEDEDKYADGIVIDESVAPEPLDEFESLENEDTGLSFKEDEFETL